MKTVYCLRIRISDQHNWGDILYYKKEINRNRYASECRIIGGYMTHSFVEQKTEKEYERIEFED